MLVQPFPEEGAHRWSKFERLQQRETRLWTVVETALHKGSSSERHLPKQAQVWHQLHTLRNALTPPSLPRPEASSLDRTVRRLAFFPVGSSDYRLSTGKAFSRTAIQTV